MIRKSLLTLVLTAIVGMLCAQSLQFEHEGTVYANNEVIICDATPNEWGEIAMEISLRNLTSETIPVVVEKEHVQIVKGTENSFCWGSCFGPDVFISRPAKELEGNSLSMPGDLSFHYQIDPTYEGDPENFISGTTCVKYYAYPQSNPEDRVCIVVWFAYNAHGVDEATWNISPAYPNPASSTVNFNINHTGIMQASVYNLLGQEVKSQMVMGGQNCINIAVDDLQPGIYFCRFTVNGEVMKTEKFIVKR